MRNTVLAFVLLAAPAFAQKTAYTPPRTPDGQPDIGGVWTNATITPLERPSDLADNSSSPKKKPPRTNRRPPSKAIVTAATAPPQPT